MPDGTILFVRRCGEDNPAILILPALGERADAHLRTLEAVAPLGTAYLMELRGHGLSEGEYSLALHRRDVLGWLRFLRRQHGHVYVVAHGLSASLLLEHEESAHRRHAEERPDLPDGMVLAEPVFGHALPRFFALRALRRRYPALRMPRDARRLLDDLSSFSLAPVRAQTPTVVLSTNDDILRRVFHARLLRTEACGTDAQRAHLVQSIARELAHVMQQERPIRFRVRT